MENDGASKIIGMGDVYLKTNTGCEFRLRNVLHVLDIRLNLISVRKLDDEGYESYFGRQRWKLTKGSLVMARGKKNNSLYITEIKLQKSWTNVMEKEVPIELWHKRQSYERERTLEASKERSLTWD